MNWLMASEEFTPDLFTSEQAASYLQVNRETVYRYIRQGKLDASRVGRGYRIRRNSLERLLWLTRARPDITPRRYRPEQLDQFLLDDTLDDETREITRQFDRAIELAAAQPAEEAKSLPARP